MKHKIKKILAKLYALIMPETKGQIVLLYHSVHPSNPSSIHPQQFEKQIAYLTNDFSDKSVLITFDDGYEDNFKYAFPILKKYSYPATFFITTGFINQEFKTIKGNRTYQKLKPLKPNQIKTMSNQKMLFGSHTHSHPVLSKISLREAETEIKKSKLILEKILNKPVDIFAYPYGRPNSFNQQTEQILKKYRFKRAYSAIWGKNQPRDNPLALKRLRIDAQDSMKDFINKLKGNWDFIKWFQILIKK